MEWGTFSWMDCVENASTDFTKTSWDRQGVNSVPPGRQRPAERPGGQKVARVRNFYIYIFNKILRERERGSVCILWIICWDFLYVFLTDTCTFIFQWKWYWKKITVSQILYMHLLQIICHNICSATILIRTKYYFKYRFL